VPRSEGASLARLAYVLDLVGVAVFAVSGALAGLHRGLDLFGAAVLAAVTAIGGGTLRDVLLGRHPVFWIKDPRYLYVILAAAAVAMGAQGVLPSVERALLIADACGLGLFALSGAQVAEAGGHSAVVVVLMGTMTGVAGGVVRDVLSGTVPVLLRRDIYATAAIAGVCLYLLMLSLRMRRSWAFLGGIALVVTLRLCALAYDWQLPALGR
jgi:uncharacterized membrane protein YeiH